MLGYFPTIFEKHPQNLTGDVARQVLQTLSLLIQNIQERETIYCLFSNNHLNRILSMDFDFDEEILGYYVNVLKTISLKLDEHSAEFFLVDGAVFTLYSKSLQFGTCNDGMIRAAVRNITLSAFSIQSRSVQRCFEHEDTRAYFSTLVDGVMQSCYSLDSLLMSASADPMDIEQLLCHIEDEFVYFNEVYSTGVPVVVCVVMKSFWRRVIVNLCVSSLVVREKPTQQQGKKETPWIHPTTALVILEMYITTLSNRDLLSLLVSMVLGGDSLTLGNSIIQEHRSLDVSDVVFTDNPAEAHSIRDILIRYLREADDGCLVMVILRLIASILANANMPDDLLCITGLSPFDAMAREQDKAPVRGEDTSIQSFPVDVGDIFESISSACFSDRYGDVLEAIFSSIKSPYTSPLTIMTARWILSKMMSTESRSQPYQREAKSLLDSYYTRVFSKHIATTDWVDSIPVLMTQCWSQQAEMNPSVLFSVRSSVSFWKATQFLQYMESQGFHHAQAKNETLCLLCIMGFVSRYQLYQVVTKGKIENRCPFPGPLWKNVVKRNVQRGDMVRATHGAFPINANRALLKIWKSSDTQCMWYEQIISLAVLEKYTEGCRVTAVVPLVAAHPTMLNNGDTLCVSIRPQLDSVVQRIAQSPLGLNFYNIENEHKPPWNQIKISFESSQDCAFVQSLVGQIVEDLRDRCSQYIVSLLPS